MNRMYERALEIARLKSRGGEDSLVFKKPYLDAAFSGGIYQWDTCFIACWAKYHQQELPIYQALDNFYQKQEDDGYICREYRADSGMPLWPKGHPTSINAPIFSWAERELFEHNPHRQKEGLNRLRCIFPVLEKYHDYLRQTYQGEDGLYFWSALGSGMDNLPRWPRGWEPDGKGLLLSTSRDIYIDSKMVERGNRSPLHNWNRQGRFIDLSAQMAFDAGNLAKISRLIGEDSKADTFQREANDLGRIINEKCWNEEDGFYYDLAFDKQVRRIHIGAFWMLLAEQVPPERLERFVAPLNDPNHFLRPMPIPSLSASDPDYEKTGHYWRGGVWAPANYMVLRGLMAQGFSEIAKNLALKMYRAVEKDFKKSNTFWEAYAPETGGPSIDVGGKQVARDFCGWSAIFSISLYHEFVK